MRARNIKPSFFDNEVLAKMGACAQILFEGLWCLADRDGKLEDRPERIKIKVFPYYEPTPSVDEILTSFANLKDPFIIRYEVDKKKFIKVVNFLKHQRPHQNETDSIIPDPIKQKQRLTKKKLITKDESTCHQGTTHLLPNPPESLFSDSLNPDTITPPTPPRGTVSDFDSFWRTYPKKVGKGAALRSWENLKKKKLLPDLSRLLEAIEEQRSSPQWQKDGGQFIPHPATWLNQQRWEDQVEPEPKSRWAE